MDWQFDSDLDSWSPTADVAWDGAFGLPPGCVAFTHGGGADGGSIDINPAYVIVTGDYISFYYRSILSSISCILGYMIDCQITTDMDVFNLRPACEAVGDSGWLRASLNLSAHNGETITNIQIATINLVLVATGIIYLDYVKLGTELPLPPVSNFDLVESGGGIPGSIKVTT